MLGKKDSLLKIERSWFLEQIVVSPPGFHLMLAAILAMLWGFWLWNPMWDQPTFDISSSYQVLHNIAATPSFGRIEGESLWGGLFSGTGAILFASALRKNILLSRAMLAFLVFLWAMVAYSFAFSNFQSTGTVVYAGVVVLHLVMYLRVFSSY